MENDMRHALLEASVDWQPHAGEREVCVRPFKPARPEKHRGGEARG